MNRVTMRVRAFSLSLSLSLSISIRYMSPLTLPSQAIHPFVASDDTQVSFDMGEIIDVLEFHPSGWWLGELSGNRSELRKYLVIFVEIVVFF